MGRLSRILLFLLMLGPPVTGGAAPQRVVSLDLCTDWLVADALPPARVAGLSPLHRRYPVDWVGNAWPTHDGALETLIALQPDLVITGEYNALQLRERLRALGVRVAVLPLPQTLAGVAQYQQRFRQLLALPDVDPPAAGVDARPPEPLPPQRLLLLGANGLGTGTNTLEHAILRAAGWHNYLTSPGVTRLDLEAIAARPPDAVLWSAPASPALANRFAEHPVLARLIDARSWLAVDHWRWQCPGPWTWDLIAQLRTWRNP
mgnify:CR=1 FL=1